MIQKERTNIIKKIRIILILLILSAFLLSGCGAVKFDITSSSSKARISIKDVEDGTYAEISTMTVSNGKTVHVGSSLNKGKLRIEFCETIKVSAAGEENEYVAGNIAGTIEIGPGENIDVSLPSGRYVLQLTTAGQTDGTVEININ